jgi:hypothetical protein
VPGFERDDQRERRPRALLRPHHPCRKKADHDYEAQELELRHNTHLTELVHALTVEIHQAVNAVAAHERDNTGDNAEQMPTPEPESPRHVTSARPARSTW